MEPLHSSPVETIDPRREAPLRALLGDDYEFARDSGLIDMFAYNPETGQDALLHTLVGEVKIGEDGAKVVEGFHHEPAPKLLENAGLQIVESRVDRDHLEGLPAKKRAEHREDPCAPYKAKVFLGGVIKLSVEKNKETGEEKLVETKNGMFPKEYDPLAVMQSIRIARDIALRDKPDPSIDNENFPSGGRGAYLVYGEAPMIDNTTTMRMRFVLDTETDQIITVSPVPRVGAMKLTPKEAREHVVNDAIVIYYPPDKVYANSEKAVNINK